MFLLKELVFHGRGGYGAVMAAELVAIAAEKGGKYSQAFPFFGGERRGAPIKSFVRIDDKPIMLHSQIYAPDIIAVFDGKLLKTARETINVSMLKENGILLINAPDKTKVGDYTEGIKLGNTSIAYVDATRIANDLSLIVAGWPVVNTAMLGALAKVSNIITLEQLKEAISEYWHGDLSERNLKAAEAGYNGVINE